MNFKNTYDWLQNMLKMPNINIFKYQKIPRDDNSTILIKESVLFLIPQSKAKPTPYYLLHNSQRPFLHRIASRARKLKISFLTFFLIFFNNSKSALVSLSIFLLSLLIFPPPPPPFHSFLIYLYTLTKLPPYSPFSLSCPHCPTPHPKKQQIP